MFDTLEYAEAEADASIVYAEEAEEVEAAEEEAEWRRQKRRYRRAAKRGGRCYAF